MVSSTLKPPMERISSRFTFISKWIFPVVWVGFLLFFVGEFLSHGRLEQEPIFLLGPIFILFIGVYVMKQLLWDLADSVDDHGSYLIVRRHGKEAKIQLANIMNVSSTTFVNPPRVTLRLIEPCELGKNVSFSPRSTFSLNSISKNVVAEGLIERAFAARSKREL